jgi:hypothetical protein
MPAVTTFSEFFGCSLLQASGGITPGGISETFAEFFGCQSISSSTGIYAGFDWDIKLTAIVPSTWVKAIFTGKRSLADSDPESLIQIVTSNPANAGTDGLVVMMAEPGTLANGSMTITGNEINLKLKAVETTKLNYFQDRQQRRFRIATDFVWNIQFIESDGDVPQVVLNSKFNIIRMATRTTN